MIEAGANESGDRSDEVSGIDRERLSRTLQDLADFIDMAMGKGSHVKNPRSL